MEITNEIKNLITQSQNICLIPAENEPESFAVALALFYTLKELEKNVNLITSDYPQKLGFLIPSLDFISAPKNLIISIPKTATDISQIYYEKNEENLKIHLTLDKGGIKKENIAIYYAEPKPDVIISLGIKDFQSQLEKKLNEFGYLLDSPIINVDVQDSRAPEEQTNKKFGHFNIIENNSLAETVLEIVKSIKGEDLNQNLANKNTANCLLAGLMLRYPNFRGAQAEVFELTEELIKQGADYQKVNDSISFATERELSFFNQIFKNLQAFDNMSIAAINSQEYQDFSAEETDFVVEKIKSIGFPNDFLVLWGSHASPFVVKGFFYSRNSQAMQKVLDAKQGTLRKDWLSLLIQEPDIDSAQKKIISILHSV